MNEPKNAASYGPKTGLALYKPADKHGSEVSDRSVMTSARERSDLDWETVRISTSGRTLRSMENPMAKRRGKDKDKRKGKFAVLDPDAAGIDIGAEEIYVAV